jgi:hypothetical protein
MPLLLACAMTALFALLDGWAEDFSEAHGLRINASSYDAMLEAIAGVGGVFLALYFTALSAVAAAVYATVPHDIRSLIIRDRLGNMYVRGVALATALAVLLLAVRSLTDSIYEAGVPFIGILAAFSIFAFITLGQRAFYLADPTRLADTLVYDFQYWMRRAAYGGWRWNDAAFQDHYRRQARKAVSSLASLMDIANSQAHLRGDSVRRLASTIGYVIGTYLAFRRRIPTDSRWFGERYQHKQWYLTDSTELEMATQTATSLGPKVVPDIEWVEEQLLHSLIASLEQDLMADSYEGAFATLESFPALWDRMGQAWATSEGIRWASRVTEATVSAMTTRDTGKRLSRPALMPGMGDLLASIPMSLELGLHRAIHGADPSTAGQRLAEADWSDTGSPYAMSFPRSVVESLESAQRGVAFELSADVPSDTATPGWYVREIALNSYEIELKRQIVAVVDFLATWYPATADRVTKAGMHEAAGAILSRALEVAWKLEAHVYDWEEAVEKIRAFPLNVDLKRPEWDWASIRGAVRTLRTETLLRLARSIPELIAVERDPDIPDYLGHAVHRSGEACFEALVSNDQELFNRLFPGYFYGALIIADRLRPEVENWQPQTAVMVLSEPVLDVLDLSGYALIFSELHKDESFQQTCEDIWKRYLGEDDGEHRIKFVAALLEHKRRRFGLSPRSILRTRWEMRLGAELRKLPRRETRREPFFHDTAAVHDSPLIRELAPGDDLGMVGVQASDVFVVRFLRNLESAGDLDFGVPDWVAQKLTSPEEPKGDDAA